MRGFQFSLKLPNAPDSIDVIGMSSEQIHEKLQTGYESYKARNTQNAAAAFEKFREMHN